MAKGQMRSTKEKKKPKADKEKPKQVSAYKLSQMQGSSSSPYSNPPGKEVLIITAGQRYLLSNLAAVPGFVLPFPGR